jgi:hypothetical protein
MASGKKRTKRQEDALFLKSTKIRKLPHDESHTRQHITLTRHTKEEVMPSTPKPSPEFALKPHTSLLSEPEARSTEELEDEEGSAPDPIELEGEQTQVSGTRFLSILFG